MSITLDLQADLLQRLQQQAEARRLSLHEWLIEVLSRASDCPDQPGAWQALNARRFQLIHKRHHGGLGPGEEAELNELQNTADKLLEPQGRQRLEMLELTEAPVERFVQSANG